jgi:hypothetical protein
MNRATRCAAALASLSILYLGCAGASVEGAQRINPYVPLARPPVFLVYDFAVTPEDVVVDSFGSDFAPPQESPEPLDDDRAVARALAEAIVERLQGRGISAQHCGPWSEVPANAFVLKGQFVTINEGSRLARMTIGFGVGRQDLRVRAQVYQWSGTLMHRVRRKEARGHGDRMPGMALPMGVGAAATGGVALLPAVIGGSLQVTQEVVGELRPTIHRLADVITEETVQFYQSEGWL